MAIMIINTERNIEMPLLRGFRVKIDHIEGIHESIHQEHLFGVSDDQFRNPVASVEVIENLV